ncbi:hypothetical protein BM529_15295, partial [Clostridioides difficile]
KTRCKNMAKHSYCSGYILRFNDFKEGIIVNIKSKIFCVFLLLGILCMSTVNSFASENMYQGYNETINLSTGEITSGNKNKRMVREMNGKDSIVYCYD